MPCEYVTTACISCVLHVDAIEKTLTSSLYFFNLEENNVLSDPKFGTSPKGMEYVR